MEKKYQEIANTFVEFCKTVEKLRDPKEGCPWDLEQNHKTLRKYMIEEAYEAAEAMDCDDYQELCGELGDVLLQVVLNAQIAKDEGNFQLVEVIKSIDDKMKRRHPHVFGTEDERKIKDISSIKDNWASVKEMENQGKKTMESVFGDRKVQKAHPASRKTLEIGKLAKKIRFDWDNSDQVLQQFLSEVEELKYEFNQTEKNHQAIYLELGDVYFTLGQLCRHLELDPELVAEDGNRKFLKRFANMEKLIVSDQLELKDLSQDQMEEYWKKAKLEEK